MEPSRKRAATLAEVKRTRKRPVSKTSPREWRRPDTPTNQRRERLPPSVHRGKPHVSETCRPSKANRKNGSGARGRPQASSERQSHAAQAVWPGDGYRKNRRGIGKQRQRLITTSPRAWNLSKASCNTRGGTRGRASAPCRKKLHENVSTQVEEAREAEGETPTNQRQNRSSSPRTKGASPRKWRRTGPRPPSQNPDCKTPRKWSRAANPMMGANGNGPNPFSNAQSLVLSRVRAGWHPAKCHEARKRHHMPT